MGFDEKNWPGRWQGKGGGGGIPNYLCPASLLSFSRDETAGIHLPDLLVNLHDADGVGACVRHDGAAEADDGVSAELLRRRVLLGDGLLQVVVCKEPVHDILQFNGIQRNNKN